MNQIWEYKITPIPWEFRKKNHFNDKGIVEKFLNEMGKQGWELIPTNNLDLDKIFCNFLFKRCLTSEHPYR